MRNPESKMKFIIIILSLVIIGSFSLASGIETIKLTDRNNHNIKHIGIEWSKTCESLMITGDQKTCSTKEFIKSLYPDTKLKQDYQNSLNNLKNDEQTKFKTNNYISKQKLSCISKDYCDIFQVKRNQKVLFWFDPDYDVRGYLDFTITIQSNMLDKNPNFAVSPISDNGTNRKISFKIHDLYIHSCDTAIIRSDQLYIDLGKILYYALKDCQNPEILGKLKDNYEEPLSKHILDITTSNYWQEQQKMKADIERCKVKC